MGLNAGALVSGALSGVPVIGGALSGIASAIGGLFGGSEPDGRYAVNATLYKEAMAGNPNAAKALKARGGLGDETLTGPANNGAYRAGQVIGKWPDSPPHGITADAAAKYGQVIAAAAQGSGGAANALGPVSASTPIGTAAAQAGNALLQPAVAGLPMWAVLGGAAAAGYLLLRRR